MCQWDGCRDYIKEKGKAMANEIIIRETGQPQVIKTQVTELSRGPQGPEGPAGADGADGRDGAIQYTAGTGISISSSNVISATGSSTTAWGNITGSLSNQTDLKNALDAKAGTTLTGALTDLTTTSKTNLVSAINEVDAVASNVGNINDLTTTAKTNTVAAINEVNGKARFDIDYSSTEIDTGATWVDGSKIYKKTVFLGLLPNAGNKTVAHNIANLDRVVKIEAIIHNGGTYAMIPFVHTQAVTGNININVNTTDITISTGNDRTSWSGDCTIYYTKTS